MKPGLGLINSALLRGPNPVTPPTFLIKVEPWHRTFFRNLFDLFAKSETRLSPFSAPPGVFWDDVFVKSRLPWGRFAESVIFHTAAIAVLWSSAQLWPYRPQIAVPLPFHKSDVVTYDLSEYLPPLDTGSTSPGLSQKSDPVYAPQPIISVPPDSDNRQQTVVTPPQLKLTQEVPLPNVVAWTNHETPAIPPAATAEKTSDLRLPAMSAAVVAPPPEVNPSQLSAAPALPTSVVAPAPEISVANTRREIAIAQPAVIAPPPGVELAAIRKSDINIGHAQVVAPAPELPMDEQHAVANFGRASLGNSSPAVVPPPPAVQAASASQQGRLVALSINPAAPTGPVEVPNGNRRGTFAATPEGKPGASGTPAVSGRADGGVATGSRKAASGLPSGLFVGEASKALKSVATDGRPSATDPSAAADPPMMAMAGPPRSLAAEMSPEQQSDAERAVFGVRKSYSMTLNVPNLNSAGGSLVIHFSELKEGGKGDLFAPVVTRAVAPGYPLELMRENVQGTVELSAVIHSDGSVGEVRVLNEVDERLQAYARNAILRWQFLPALRNGAPVALQAVVRIPFKPRAKAF